MDPLSVTASVTGLFALTVQLIAAVESIVRSVKSQPKTLQNVLQELRALQLVLEQLEKCVEPGTSLAVDDRALIAVLDGCTGTYQKIGNELFVLQAKLKENLATRIYTQITFTSKMKALDALRDELEKYKATLGIALQLRSFNASPEDLRKEISDLRMEIKKSNSRLDVHSSRMGAVQEYLMTTSNVVERKGLPSRTEDSHPSSERQITLADSESSQTESSTTLVHRSSTPSEESFLDSQENRLETFQSFKEWLSSFAPTDEGGIMPENEKNLAVLREAHPELRQKLATSNSRTDTAADSTRRGLPKHIMPDEFDAASFDEQTFDPPNPSIKSKSIRVVVTDLRKPDSPGAMTEILNISTDAQIYELIDMLHRKGYTNICGFKVEGSDPIGPITGFESAHPLLVTSGRSNYNLKSGLRINEDESLAEFYDNLLTLGMSHKPRPTFSIQRKLHGLVVRDEWLNRNIAKDPELTITFDRTLRVPEDGQTYHLPAILGTFPLLLADYFKHRLPSDIARKGGILLPMFQREGLVISFHSNEEEFPGATTTYAVRIYAGSVNTLTGDLGQYAAANFRQDYVVTPRQRRIDGFCSVKGVVKQFVSMPLGFSYTAESQLTNDEFIGGIQLEIARRFKGKGHFSLDGGQRFFGSLAQPTIATPGALDRFKTPRQLGLAPGIRIFVEGQEIETLARSMKVDNKHFETLKEERFFPRCEDRCRPGFIHELYMRSRNKLLSMPKSLNLVTVRPWSLYLEPCWGGRKRHEVRQSYSQFLHTRELENLVSNDVSELLDSIKFEGAPHDRYTPFYDPIENYTHDGGMVSYFPATLGISGRDALDKYAAAPEMIRGGTWEMGFAAGGGIHQEICEDLNPKQWNWNRSQLLNVQILNSLIFESVTGMQPPPCPISIQDYIEGKMPFYQILHDSSIEVSGSLQRLRSVGEIDATSGIPINILARKDSGPSGCAVCSKNLCDSILQPCKHSFCFSCIQKYMKQGDSVSCAACLKAVSNVVEFSAPMELPLRSDNDRSEPHTREPTGMPYHNKSKKAIDHEALTSIAEMLGLKPTSPELAKFLQSISALNSGRSTLQDAASSGEISEVRRLLATGSYVDEVATENGGRTALQAAAENGHTEVVRILLDAGASVNEAPAPEDGLTSLQAASGKGNCELVKLLINAGADTNAPACRINGRTAVQAASEAGHVEVVKILIQNHANVNELCCQVPNVILAHGDCPGQTSLHFAARNGHAGTLLLLLEIVLAQNLAVSLDSILLIAAANGLPTAVEFLLNIGLDPNATNDQRCTALHEATKGGHTTTVMLLLEHHADIKAQTQAKETSIFLAAKYGHEGIIKLLMDRYGTFEPQQQASRPWEELPKQYERALHLCVETNDLNAVQMLLRIGFDPNGNVKGMQETPLFIAAKGGHVAILELLLEYGADMHNAVDGHAFYEQKLTAIHVAAEGGHEAVVRLLLSKGVSHKTPCDDGYEPLHAAIEADNENIVRLLLNYGAEPGAATRLGENSLHYAARKASKPIVELLLSKGVDHNAPGYLESTPLHEAAKFGRLAALALLLDLGANPNTTDRLGQTPLHLAVMFGLFNPVRLLLERGADPHISTRNEPLLHLLIYESYFSLGPKEASSLPAESEDRRRIASLLTQHGVDINAVPKTGSETVLVKAIRNKCLTMTHFLLDLGAKPTAPAIHAAAWLGFGDVVGWLLAAGADIEEEARETWSRDMSINYGMLLTPLHSATAQGQTEMVHFLLDHGATIDVRVGAGMTPLHLASRHGRYSVAIALLERGADVSLRMDRGMTALHLAAWKGYSQVAWLLMEHGADDAALTEDGNTALDLATENYQLATIRVLEQRRKGRSVGRLPGSDRVDLVR